MYTLIQKYLIASSLLLLTINLIGQPATSGYAPLTYLMQFEPGTTAAEIEAVKDSMQCNELWVSPITNTHLWKVEGGFPYHNNALNIDIIDINEQRDVSEERAHVDEVDLNYYFNVGPNGSNSGPINNYCYEGINNTDGDASNIKISIMDTGFDGSLNGVTPSTFKNYLGSNPNAIQDQHGHGGHIFSIIENTFMVNSGLPATHLLWDIRRTHDQNGKGELSNIILALEEAVLDGADIVNMSFSYIDPAGLVSQAVMNHVMDVIETNNVLVIVAAGNDGEDLNKTQSYNCFPSELPSYNILSVGSFNCQSDSLSAFSNYGVESVDITAPGDHIEGYSGKNFTFSQKSGTSQATAIVSGVAATLALFQSSFDYIGIKCAILKGAEYKSSLSGLVLTDGFLDAEEALNELLAGCTDIIDPSNPLQMRTQSKDLQNDNFSVYPNPAQSIVYIELNEELENAQLSLIGANGQVIMRNDINGKSITINVDAYPQGLYSIKVTSGTKNMYQNIVIQK